ncbi:MAG: DUF2851 family protein [Sphingobacteriales bacterium]|nr:DUF2851 family protein [Sphingobacteriales bacterium]
MYPRELKAEYQFLKQNIGYHNCRNTSGSFCVCDRFHFQQSDWPGLQKVVQQMPLLTKILKMKDEDFFLEDIEVSDYWSQHYVFDKLSKLKSKSIGDDFKSIVKINVVAPILYAYGKCCGEEKYKDKAFDVLYKTTAEVNNKTKKYTNQIWQQNAAFDTQAVIELNDSYCTGKRCLECAIGYKILRNSNNELLANNC